MSNSLTAIVKIGSRTLHSKVVNNKIKYVPADLDGCVLYFAMEEKSYNLSLDHSGHNNHGTIYGAVESSGKIGTGLSFDGVDDYVDCGNAASLDFGTGDFSVGLWVKAVSMPSHHSIFLSKRPTWGLSGEGFVIWHDNTIDGDIRIDLNDGEHHIYTWPGTGTNDENWHQLIMVADRTANELILYFDGVNKGVRDISGIASIDTNRHLSIGARLDQPVSSAIDYHFNGTIDEVRIYNRALSEHGILASYQQEV